MKKILVFILCALLLCAMPLVALADEVDSAPIETETVPEENVTPEEEIPVEGEISGDETVEEEPSKIVTVTKSVTDQIVDYFKSEIEEYSIMGILVAIFLFIMRSKSKGEKILGKTNNNAILISETSTKIATDAKTELKELKEKFGALLEQYEDSALTSAQLTQMALTTEALMKSVKVAVSAMGEEITNLILLAHIPNEVKDKFVAIHSKAMSAIEALEVKSDDGINS